MKIIEEKTLTPTEKKARRLRNYAIGGMLLLFFVILYIVTIFRMSAAMSGGL